jgi:MFS family permease
MYHWPFVKVLLPFLPALILLPFLLLKPNRQAKAWLMLVPFGLIAAIVLAGQRIPLSAPADVFAYAYPYVVMLASSLCIMCLMTYAMPSWSFAKKFLAIPTLSILPGAVILFFAQGVGEALDSVMLAAYGLAPLVLLLSFTLAGRRCRERWRLRRFSLLSLVWTLLLVSALILLLLGFAIMMRQAPPSGVTLLLQFVISLLVVAVILFIIAFPFVLTAFLSPFYRERLMAAFKVIPAPLADRPASGGIAASPADAG